jgi:hypothetical protein
MLIFPAILAVLSTTLPVQPFWLGDQSGSSIIRCSGDFDTTFTWNAGDEGWTRTNDFIRSNSFTKLSGPYDGYSMVTVCPAKPGRYTEGAYADSEGYPRKYPGPNFLICPKFDFSRTEGGPVVFSFMQSINVEPEWDLGWWEYSADGNTWKHLGRLNDTDGLHWYDTTIFPNARLHTPSSMNAPPDTLTLQKYGLIRSASELEDFPVWTSTGSGHAPGEDLPAGPAGWIKIRLEISPALYPEIYHSSSVQFRYVAFSDAAAAFQGWAIDNVRIAVVRAEGK